MMLLLGVAGTGLAQAADVGQYKNLVQLLNATTAEQNLGALGLHLRRTHSATKQDYPIGNTWLEGQWSNLEGAPMVGNNALSYRGESMGLYGGVERHIERRPNGWILGLAGGYQSSDIDAPLGVDGLRDDRLTHDSYSLFPYAEWHRGALYLRAVGGWGDGEFRLRESGSDTCDIKMDAETYFGGASGKLTAVENDNWDFNIIAEWQINKSTIDGGTCAGQSPIPEMETRNRAAAVGIRTDFGKDGNVRPFMAADIRREIGGLSNTAYDFSLGVEMLRGKWNINAEGRIQLNDSDYRRHTVRGMALYSGDEGYQFRWSSGLQTNAATIGMVSKWQAGRIVEWKKNTINAATYYEMQHHFGGTAAQKIGAEIQIDFLGAR